MRINGQKGVTLVELMITVAIIGAISLGVGSLLMHGIRLWTMSSNKAEMQREVRTAISMITDNLKQAEATSIVIDSFDASQPPYSRIAFQNSKGQVISYYQNGNTLYQNTASGDYKLMRSLRNIVFTYPDTSETTGDQLPIINCSICAETKVWGGQTKVFQLNFEKIRVMN